MLKPQLQNMSFQGVSKNSPAMNRGGSVPPASSKEQFLPVIPQSFEADFDVLKSLWQHESNFEKQSKSGFKSNNSLKEVIWRNEPDELQSETPAVHRYFFYIY